MVEIWRVKEKRWEHEQARSGNTQMGSQAMSAFVLMVFTSVFSMLAAKNCILKLYVTLTITNVKAMSAAVGMDWPPTAYERKPLSDSWLGRDDIPVIWTQWYALISK